MSLRIGLLVGRESSFPLALIEEVNRRDAGVVAEMAAVGEVETSEPARYAVLIDRVSHEVPFYRAYLRHAALQGTTVINSPLIAAGGPFHEAALAARLGIATPRAALLPQKEYAPGVGHESLRNLVYPLDWERIVAHVGLPCILKDAQHSALADRHVCHSLEELLRYYDRSGQRLLMVQEIVEWDHFVRCLVLGEEHVLLDFGPGEPRNALGREPIPPELERRVIADSLKLVRGIGYDVASLGWAVRGGVPYAINAASPVPDFDEDSLTPTYFDWVVEHLADLAISRALGRPVERPKEVDGRLTGESDVDGAGDLAEEFPSLARDLPHSEV